MNWTFTGTAFNNTVVFSDGGVYTFTRSVSCPPVRYALCAMPGWHVVRYPLVATAVATRSASLLVGVMSQHCPPYSSCEHDTLAAPTPHPRVGCLPAHLTCGMCPLCRMERPHLVFGDPENKWDPTHLTTGAQFGDAIYPGGDAVRC